MLSTWEDCRVCFNVCPVVHNPHQCYKYNNVISCYLSVLYFHRYIFVWRWINVWWSDNNEMFFYLHHLLRSNIATVRWTCCFQQYIHQVAMRSAIFFCTVVGFLCNLQLTHAVMRVINSIIPSCCVGVCLISF